MSRLDALVMGGMIEGRGLRLVKRRHLLAGLAAAGACGMGGGALATWRWNSTPRQNRFLTDAHLNTLAANPPPRPRVLFVGNSFTHQHNIPARVAQLATAAGSVLNVGMAAGDGARLVETWRIAALRPVLDLGWDGLVLQDFSATALRVPDRWGSAWAMSQMAETAGAKHVLLYPTWAFPSKHGFYHGRAGRLTTTPRDPAHFAKLITAHYESVARNNGWTRAPVTEAFLPSSAPYLGQDIHHLNGIGADLVADILWQAMAEWFTS